MNEVIVTGGSHHNTYGVIRALGKKKLKPFLLLVNDSNNSFLLRSKYLGGYQVVDTEQHAIDFLFNNKDKYEGAVVIACSDGMSSALDCNRYKLGFNYKLPGADVQGQISSIMDKDLMSSLGKKVGFNIPESWIVSSLHDIDVVEYPCITKPIISKDGHKTDIEICQNKCELENIIKNGSCYKYQVQQFIEKEFEYQLIGLSLNNGNELIIPGFSRCIRPCPRTNTGFLHYESLDCISAPIDLCKKFVQATGYSGLFSIEFLRDKQGTDYFMEMNFRNDGNAICVTAAGINLPYLWYLANTGKDYKKELKQSTMKSVFVMPEFPDFLCFVKSGKISFFKWIKDVLKTNTFMVFNISDVSPFMYIFKDFLKRALNKF